MDQSVYMKIISAFFYGVASFLIVVVNKTILTTYRFPSFQVLAFGQMVTTIVVLFAGRKLRYIDFPSFSSGIVGKIWPLPMLYAGNLVFGLGGTKRISLPMYTVIRRFSILMTMFGEQFLLGTVASLPVKVSVYAMTLGSLLAALNDFGFDAVGYAFVTINNVFSAANGVYVKQKLDNNKLGKYGLLFYNSLFMLPFTTALCWYTGDFSKAAQFENWMDLMFLMQFLASCMMGFVLMYSIMLCTQHNSALTTTIIGCLKNILVTYLGMYIGGDYIFSFLNFLGLNISVFGSLAYTYIVFKTPSKS